MLWRDEECLDWAPGQEQSFRLADTLLASPYPCHGTEWSDGGAPRSFATTCPAIDECQLVNCWICLKLFTNPEYYPFCFLGGLVVALVVFCTGLCLCLSICRQVRKNLGDCFHAAIFLLRRCFPHRRPTTHPAVKRRGKYRLVQSAGWGLAALFSHGPSIETVSPDTLVLTARSEECFRNNTHNWCTWNHISSTTIKPGPLGLQLLMRNHRNQTLSTATVTVDRVDLQCTARTLKWSYNYHLEVYSEKRCPGLENCTGSSCATWPATATVPEIRKQLSGQSSGTSLNYCLESCGTWTCGFPIPPHIPVSACTFYTIKAVPQVATVYHLFSCAAWQPEVRFRIAWQTANGSWARNFTALPGMTYSHDNLVVTVPTLAIPPTPSLADHFLSNGHQIALASDGVDDIHCRSYEEAANHSNCSLHPEACRNCQLDGAAGNTVACHCRASSWPSHG